MSPPLPFALSQGILTDSSAETLERAAGSAADDAHKPGLKLQPPRMQATTQVRDIDCHLDSDYSPCEFVAHRSRETLGFLLLWLYDDS